MSENVRKRYQERIGHCHFRWFGELGSINVNHRRPKTLASYPGKRSYHAVWEGTELLVLETGPDAYNKTINLFKPIHWRVLFDEMACKGLDEEQLALLRRRLDAGRGSILIFTHAPPLFSMEDFPPIDLSHDGRLKSRVSDRVFIDGNKEFLEALLQSARNITVISSHTHIPRQFLLDKHTGTLRHCDMDEFNRVRDDPRYLKFLITLPLGGVRTQNRAVGYLRLDGRGFQYVVLRDFSRRRRG